MGTGEGKGMDRRGFLKLAGLGALGAAGSFSSGGAVVPVPKTGLYQNGDATRPTKIASPRKILPLS